ncbi:MAG: hypothetical protein ACK2UM_19970 [Anaerolineales bacterium]
MDSDPWPITQGLILREGTLETGDPDGYEVDESQLSLPLLPCLEGQGFMIPISLMPGAGGDRSGN